MRVVNGDPVDAGGRELLHFVHGLRSTASSTLARWSRPDVIPDVIS
jgi:hypothetical protein